MRTTRRTWLAGAGLGLTAACGRRKGTGFPGYALIATAGENSLCVVNLMEFRLEEPIPLGAAPTAVVPGNNGVSYVLTPASGSVHLISPARKAISSVHLGPGVTQIRQTPDGKALLGISPETAELTRAEVDNFKTRRTHQLKAKPYAMDAVALDPAHDLLAVSEGESGWVELFDFASGKRWSRQLGGRIGDLRFRADGRLLLVANLAGRSLTALSVPKLEPIADLPLAMNPENLCFDRKDQGQLFVTGEGMDGVAIVFPYRVLQVDQTVLAGRDPGVMASSANPALLFVASASGSDICVLNIDSRKVIGLVDVAEHPTYITITPDDQYALILNRSSGVMIAACSDSPTAVTAKVPELTPRADWIECTYLGDELQGCVTYEEDDSYCVPGGSCFIECSYHPEASACQTQYPTVGGYEGWGCTGECPTGEGSGWVPPPNLPTNPAEQPEYFLIHRCDPPGTSGCTIKTTTDQSLSALHIALKQESLRLQALPQQWCKTAGSQLQIVLGAGRVYKSSTWFNSIAYPDNESAGRSFTEDPNAKQIVLSGLHKSSLTARTNAELVTIARHESGHLAGLTDYEISYFMPACAPPS